MSLSKLPRATWLLSARFSPAPLPRHAEPPSPPPAARHTRPYTRQAAVDTCCVDYPSESRDRQAPGSPGYSVSKMLDSES